MILLLSRKNESWKQWKSFYNKCAFKMSGPFLAMLNLDSKNLNQESHLINYLKKHGFRDRKIKEVASFYKQKQERKKIRSLILLWNEYDKKWKKIVLPADKYFLSTQWLKQIRNNEDYFIGKLIVLFLALKNNNLSWARETISQIVHFNKPQIILNMQTFYFYTPEEYKNFIDNILRLLRVVREKLGNTCLVKLFIKHLARFLPAEIRNRVLDIHDLNWSLDEVKQVYKTCKQQKNNIDLWHGLFTDYIRSPQIFDYLNNYLNVDSLKEMTINSLWTISSSLSKNDAITKVFVSQVKEQMVWSRLLDRYFLIIMAKNNYLKKLLTPIYTDLVRPQFQLEREYFRELINKGEAIEFSLYHLIKLGELNQELLWWLVL